MNIKTMMIVRASMNKPDDTFKLVPIHDDCPFVEAFFDVETDMLVLFNKNKRFIYNLIDRVDSAGNKLEGKKHKKLQENYHETYIRNREDILTFIRAIAVNAEVFEFDAYLPVRAA